MLAWRGRPRWALQHQASFRATAFVYVSGAIPKGDKGFFWGWRCVYYVVCVFILFAAAVGVGVEALTTDHTVVGLEAERV